MKPETARTILVLGGTGVFGSRLAAGLIRDGIPSVTIAGRGEARLREVAARLGCRWQVLDRGASTFAADIRRIAPFAVVDASGPFQGYGVDDPYRVAHAAIAAGAHYFDLSDDAGFTAGIGALDGSARAEGVAVLSGVSSVPAVSAAAVHALAENLERIDLIDSMILPGNRAPRGRSVTAAILRQAGRPSPGSDRLAWIGSERVVIAPPGRSAFTRLASPIGAPDLLLMPRHFKAHEVRFRAGLELWVMHKGLELIAHAVRLGLLRNAATVLSPAHLAARALERFGTDVGAMRVLVRGEAADGTTVERIWTLVADAGDGPHVPAIPGRILAGKLMRGEVATGARACLDDLTLEECEAAAPELALEFFRKDRPYRPLFEEVLDRDWTELPEPVRGLHRLASRSVWRGEAQVSRGRHPIARLVAALFRFPPEAVATPVTVTMSRREDQEIWTRDFGGHRFVSHLSADKLRKGRMWERFGPFAFAIDLGASRGALRYPVAAGRFMGLPLPGFVLPRSETAETVDAEGRVAFDVALSLPLVGPIVRYRGWLVPHHPISGDQELPAS